MKFTTFVDVIYNVSNKVNISYLTFEKKLNENVYMIPDDDRQNTDSNKKRSPDSGDLINETILVNTNIMYTYSSTISDFSPHLAQIFLSFAHWMQIV